MTTVVTKKKPVGERTESVPETLAKVPERIAEEIAEALELIDPRKATRNAAVMGLVGGSVTATALVKAAGVADLFNPFVLVALFALLPLALPYGWHLKDMDLRLAVRLFAAHQAGREGKVGQAALKAPPFYFRLRVPSEITPASTARMAFGPYSLSLSIGVITWGASLGIAPGSNPISLPFSGIALSVALASMGGTLAATWIVPPLWLLRTAGVRVLDPHEGRVLRVDETWLAVLGPFMGVAALGTLFIVFAIGGLGLSPALFSFAAISIALFPVVFAATYLYRTRREANAAAELARRLRALGLKTYGSLAEAVAASERPKA